MSNLSLDLLVASGLGLALGAAYCMTLWLVVRRLAQVRHPAVWLAGSAMLRVVLLLAAFVWVMDQRWELLLACFTGFLIVRFAVTRWASLSGHTWPAAPGHG